MTDLSDKTIPRDLPLDSWEKDAQARISFLEDPFTVSARTVKPMRPEETDARILSLVSSLRASRKEIADLRELIDKLHDGCDYMSPGSIRATIKAALGRKEGKE